MHASLDLADLASEQQGMVTAAQAQGLGVSAQQLARLANQGALERLTHGVYRVAGAPPSPEDGLRAAWLALDPSRRATERLVDVDSAVVSHRSAASLHGLGDLDSDDYEFTVSKRKQSRRPGVRIHRGHVAVTDRTVVDGLPATTVLRTVGDLADARVDGGHLAGVVRDALTVKLVNDVELAEALRPHARAYGAPLGDGEALLSMFLQEAGMARPLERAVELADLSHRVAAVINDTQLRQLNEQMASIKTLLDRAVTPDLQSSLRHINEYANQVVAASPALDQLRETARAAQTLANSSAQQALNDAIKTGELAAVKRQVEQINKTLDSPQVRQLLAQAKRAR